MPMPKEMFLRLLHRLGERGISDLLSGLSLLGIGVWTTSAKGLLNMIMSTIYISRKEYGILLGLGLP